MVCDGLTLRSRAGDLRVPRSARYGLESPGACTAEGNGVMSRTTGSGPTRVRLAFYGRTNHTGEKAGTDVSRQYRACSAIAAEHGAMTQWYYDAPHALDGRSCLNVRDVESRLGTPRGACRELAIRIREPHREL